MALPIGPDVAAEAVANHIPTRLAPRRFWTLRELIVILVTMSEVSSLAETKAHLSELVTRVGDQHERITITVHGRPVAVLVAVDDLESLEETIAMLSDAAMMRAINEADAELARGEGQSQDSLAVAMRARRART